MFANGGIQSLSFLFLGLRLPLALLFRLVRDGKIEKDSTTVVVLTGSGLKDPDAALKNVEPPIELDGDARTLAKVLKL